MATYKSYKENGTYFFSCEGMLPKFDLSKSSFSKMFAYIHS